MLTSQALSADITKAKAKTKQIYLSNIAHREINLHYLMIIVALYLIATANVSFFAQVLSIYPIRSNIGFMVSITGLLSGLMWLVLQLLCYRPIAKPMLIAVLMIAAVCGYFTDAYGTIFDRSMLINGLQTDQQEAMGLMSLSFFIRVLVLGVIPAVIIAKIRIKRTPLRRALWQRAVTLSLSAGLMAVCLLPFGDQYATFFRQHKMVRSYVNPITSIYSVAKLSSDYVDALRRPDTLLLHATDAKRSVASSKATKPKLMVFVVGETARADHFGLNGYARNTTPLLAEQDNLYSFKQTTSCGTSTAYSVPCMFSYANRDNFEVDRADYNENVLDTLHKQGVNVVWRDNNSSSKGVADRVTFEDFKTSKTNPSCDSECRDIGMLKGFDKLVKSTTTPKDTLIFLHQMGNHGPAYFKRYPQAFEEFKPVCMTNELSKCDNQSVINGYDNAIRYTDYFLHNVIDTLKNYEQGYDVVMVYISDHGESLGENNIYLHGLPYAIAPDSQKQIPVIIWSPASNSIDKNSLLRVINQPVSHDFITPTLLNFFNITTDEVAGAPTFFKSTHSSD
ncbi:MULTISPECIES: phosphoethanolamine transferase [unclassified Psychrobacter]|uniref:phosphoethanolamine transferase n=1 Tax=unclassified Psychrobacter TaxID=196806 RepID=UPI0025DF6F82|nr:MULTISPECIES: phosphoethanolamine--lipid A transferase [unclassified Psychrobacter]